MDNLLSIITPIYNSTSTLKAYLDSIFASKYHNFELIIVDDASENNPLSVLKDYRLVYKRLEKRNGSAYARNIGSELARGQILLFIDADIVIQAGTLGAIMQVFKIHPDISALICSYDDSPGGANLVSQFKFLQHHYVHQQEREYINSFWTGCGAIKKDAFRRLGKFDAAFFRSPNTVNDIEMGYRMQRNNLKIYNAKHIQVKHLKTLTFRDWVHNDIFNRGIPWIKIILTYKDLNPRFNLNPSNGLSVLCVWSSIFLLCASLFNHRFLSVAVSIFSMFLILNYRPIFYFARKRGVVFSLISVFYLFVYYFNCGLSVLLGLFLYKKI